MDERESAGREEQGEVMAYAPRKAPVSEPKLPGPAMKTACGFMVAAALFWIGVAGPSLPIEMIAAPLALLLACLGVWAAIVVLHRSTNPLVPDSKVPSKRSRFRLMACALLCLAISTLGMLLALRQAQNAYHATITRANLLGLGMGLELYYEDFGEFPDTLARLIDTDIATSKQFQSICDPARYGGTTAIGAVYTSFEYHICPDALLADKRVIVLYEREPWTLMKTGLFTKYGRCVLFADRHVDILSEDDFAEAMALDAEIRSRDFSAVGDTASESSEAER